jgi:hypothetical protein
LTTPILTLAEVQALSGFTEGPWEWGGTDRERFMVPGLVTPRGLYIVTAWTHTSPVEVKPAVPVDARLIAAAPALHATCLHLHAEVARLTADLAAANARLPAVGRWVRSNFSWARDCAGRTVAEIHGSGWYVYDHDDNLCASSPETGDAGRRAADLALVAAGYRLVGGVFGEVSDG